MAKKIFSPQNICGLDEHTIFEAKQLLDSYVDSLDFLTPELKNEVKNCHKTTKDDIKKVHKCFNKLAKHFKNIGMKHSYSNGDMFEVIAPLINYQDTDTIQYGKSGDVAIDCIVNNTIKDQIKYKKGVNSGVVGYLNNYALLPIELKIPYYEQIYNNLKPLTTRDELNIFQKLFMVTNNIGQKLYINDIEITEEHQKFLIDHCPQQDDLDTNGDRQKKIDEVYNFMIKTFGENVFEYYEKLYEKHYPKWEAFINGKGKKPSKCFLDYKKYDVFALNIVFKLFEDMLNICYIKEINDIVHYVAKQYNFQLLKCDREKIYTVAIETIQVKVKSQRYFGELNYHGSGTISLEFLGV